MTTILKKGKPRTNEKVEQLRHELINGSKFVKFTMNIPRKLHHDFKVRCTVENLDMKDILIEAIRKYMLT